MIMDNCRISKTHPENHLLTRNEGKGFGHGACNI